MVKTRLAAAKLLQEIIRTGLCVVAISGGSTMAADS